jgi:hypothetical protein
MNFVRSILFAVILSVSSVSVTTAQDFDKGYAAYQAGDFVTALEEFQPLAEQGDAIHLQKTFVPTVWHSSSSCEVSSKNSHVLYCKVW